MSISFSFSTLAHASEDSILSLFGAIWLLPMSGTVAELFLRCDAELRQPQLNPFDRRWPELTLLAWSVTVGPKRYIIIPNTRSKSSLMPTKANVSSAARAATEISAGFMCTGINLLRLPTSICAYTLCLGFPESSIHFSISPASRYAFKVSVFRNVLSSVRGFA